MNKDLLELKDMLNKASEKLADASNVLNDTEQLVKELIDILKK